MASFPIDNGGGSLYLWKQYAPLKPHDPAISETLKTTAMSPLQFRPLPVRCTALLVLALSCLWLSSCVTSVYPLAESSKELLYRPDLVGTWKEVEGDTYIKVEPREDTAYAITMVELRSHDSVARQDTSYFVGRLIQSGGYLLLDCVVNLEQQMDYQLLGDYTKAGLLPTHFLFHLTLHDNNRRAELAQLKEENLEPVLRQMKVHYQSDKNQQSMVLLEPSASLKKLFVQLIRERADVWDKSMWEKQ